MKDWCFQQLFGLLTALRRNGGMRDGGVVERRSNACGRGQLNTLFQISKPDASSMISRPFGYGGQLYIAQNIDPYFRTLSEDYKNSVEASKPVEGLIRLLELLGRGRHPLSRKIFLPH